MTTVASFGGGVQSVAMCLLVEQGRLPRPDYIIAADTGREVATTWNYLETYMRPRMAAIGLDIIVARHELATVDLYAKNGDMLMPVYTATGKLPTYCSVEWKARVIQRRLRSLGVMSADLWIGFSWDERKRKKADDRPPWRRSYPLLDLMLTRADCVNTIIAAGLPLPSKSRCWGCPHQHDSEWASLPPNEWAAAVALDEELREADERGAVYLHSSRIPLRDVILAPEAEHAGEQCGLGMCFL